MPNILFDTSPTGNTTSSTTSATTATWTLWNRVWQGPKGYGGGSSTWTTECDRRRSETWLEASETTGTRVTDPWPVWVQTSSATGGVITTNRFEPRISDEEYQARRALAQRREEEWKAEQREREAAKERAKVLLRESLTPEQNAELANKRYFTLTKIDAKTGERRTYRIHQGRERNIERFDESGRRIEVLCAHPRIQCPDEDTMLTQLLHLKYREAEFLRVANHMPYR